MKKILIVDDEPHILKMLESRLKSMGYEVSCASDGNEAIAKVKKDPPDLIIMDVIMPSLNGFEACNRLKNDTDYKHIPIILLTAKATESDRFWGTESGADAYVTKPYHAEELLEKVKILIGQ